MQPTPSYGNTRAQRRQAIQERILRNRNLLGRPQPPQEQPNSFDAAEVSLI